MKFCSKCGRPLTDDMNFCSGCGQKIEKEEKNEIDDKQVIEKETKESISEPIKNLSEENKSEISESPKDTSEDNEIFEVEKEEIESDCNNKKKTPENKSIPEIPKNSKDLGLNNIKENFASTSKIKNQLSRVSEILKKNKKKSILITCAAFLVIVFGVIYQVNSRPSFTALYNGYLDSKYAEVADDDSWLRIDTNPYDIDDYNSDDAINQLEVAIEKLKLPSTLAEEMYETRAMDGRQVKNYNGISVSWTYHPSQGLEVLFTKE